MSASNFNNLKKNFGKPFHVLLSQVWKRTTIPSQGKRRLYNCSVIHNKNAVKFLTDVLKTFYKGQNMTLWKIQIFLSSTLPCMFTMKTKYHHKNTKKCSQAYLHMNLVLQINAINLFYISMEPSYLFYESGREIKLL